MSTYSIKELEKISGIKAHTIRIWEKRYSMITPSRTPTNIRYYSDDDLKKIINISILRKNGIRIGTIAELNTKEISEKIEELHKLKSSPQIYQDQLLISMIDLDESKFEKLLNNLILKHGFEHSIMNVLFPFQEKVGFMWLTSNISPAHEHFITNLIRQKLIVAIDSLPLVEEKSAKKVILFLPETELHELGLLFAHFYLRKNNFRTLYLGQIVPIKDLKGLATVYNPEIVITSISTSPNKSTVEDFLTHLSRKLPNSTILVGGFMMKNYIKKLPSNVKLFKSSKDLGTILNLS